MNWHTVITSGFALGAASIVLKGGELILRPHQQKTIQNHMEHLTLWLEYKRPLLWLHNLGTERWQRGLTGVAIWYAAWAVLNESIGILAALILPLWALAVIALCVLAISALTYSRIRRMWAGPAIRWVTGDGRSVFRLGADRAKSRCLRECWQG